MAIVVSSQNTMLRTWTGSLSDLNSCGQRTSDLTDVNPPHLYSNDLNTNSEPSRLSDISQMKETDDAKALSVVDYLRIQHFLHEFHKSFTCGSVSAERLKKFPHTFRSSVINHPINSSGYITESFSDDMTALHRSNMLKDLIDTTVEEYLHRAQGFPLLRRTSRRHYNSESDITCSVSGTPHPPCNKLPLKNVHSAEFSKSNMFSPTPLTTRSTGCENLSDPTVFNTTENSQNVEKEKEEESTNLTNVEETQTAHIVESPDPVSPVQEIITSFTPSKPEESTEIKCHCVSKTKASIPIVALCDQLKTTSLDQKETSINKPAQRSSTSNLSSLTSSRSAAKLQKSVSFADEVGQSLTEIFTIEEQDYAKTSDYDELSSPIELYFRPRFDSLDTTSRFTRSKLKHRQFLACEEPVHSKRISQTNTAPKQPPIVNQTRSMWVFGFSQPAAQYYEFRQRVENGCVSLENITLTQPDETSESQLPHLSGTIKVKNLSFNKQIWIRLTTDNWRSYSDNIALYSPHLSGGLLHSPARFDTFSFQITVTPQLKREQPCDKIEFAIRYTAGENGSVGQFWDNNNGSNYVIERKTINSTFPPLSPTNCSPEEECRYAVDRFTDARPSHCRSFTSDYRPNFEGFTLFTNYRAWNHFENETTYY